MTNSCEIQKDVNNKDKKLLIPLLFLPCLFIRRVLDNDIWFLLNSGRYVVNNGIPHIEPFTIHQNMEFVMQQWLTDVIYWKIYSVFGEKGLFALVMFCYAMIIFCVFKLTMKISESNFIVSYGITFFISIFIYFFMYTRPIIFTLLIITLELYFLESFIISNNCKYLIILPVLSFMLINLHAAMWPFLFVLLLPYIIDSFKFKLGKIYGQGYEKKFLSIIIIAMIAVAFCNSYGIKSIAYLFNSYGYEEISNLVKEMQPPNINVFSGKIIYLNMFIIILIYCLYRKGKSKVRYFLLTCGTAYLALSSVRSFPFFIICGFFPLAYFLKDLTLSNAQQKTDNKTMYIRKFLISLIIIITLAGVYIKNDGNNTSFKNEDLNNTIDYIFDFEDVSDVILYTGYKDGALVQFRGLPTYIDPRAEVFVKNNNKKDDIMKEYYDLQKGDLYYKTVLDKYQFTHLLINKSDILSTYLPNDADYKLIYFNESYKLFEKVKEFD